MDGHIQYGAIVTKIRGMSAKLLKPDDYKKLSVMKSIAQIIEYLNTQTHYQGVFSGIKAETVNRDKLEQILNTTLYSDYLKVRHYLLKEDKAFIEAFMRKYEINIIKNMVRQVMSGNEARLDFETEDFFEASSFRKTKIESVKSMEQVIHAMEDTPYYEVITSLYSREKDPTLFDIEISLDMSYFSNLWKEKEKASKENKKIITECIGAEADLHNILWIYRSKKYFKVDTSYVYSYLIPVHYKLTTDMIQRLAVTENADDMSKVLEGTVYAGALDNDAQMFERAMIDFVLKDMLRSVRKGGLNISAVLWYLHAKELELGNICSIAEGVRYSLSSAEILRYVFMR
ncbi:MAG: V-type ATPase subunit [Bacillota bacterium]|nr:V-type ATPase subunit [Bacillota bacterium]